MVRYFARLVGRADILDERTLRQIQLATPESRSSQGVEYADRHSYAPPGDAQVIRVFVHLCSRFRSRVITRIPSVAIGHDSVSIGVAGDRLNGHVNPVFSLVAAQCDQLVDLRCLVDDYVDACLE
jgi:hypothetical protein